MMTLAQAIASIVKLTGMSPNTRNTFRIAGGNISTCNGTVSAIAPFAADFPDTPMVLDADALRRVWSDTAKAKLDPDANMLIVRDRSSRYKLRLLDDMMMSPDLTGGGEQMSEAARDAILLAAKFAAKASPTAWLCAVSVRGGRAVATNRVIALAAVCDMETSVTLPTWALQALRGDGRPPLIRTGSRGVTLSYDDGLIVHSAPLAELPPERLFSLVPEADDGVSLQPFHEVKQDALRLQGATVRLDPGAGSVTVLDADRVEGSVTEVDLGGAGKTIDVQDAAIRLLLAHATHISFADTPKMLRFSIRAGDKISAYGVLAGKS